MARSTKQIEGDETVHYVSPRAKRGRAKAKISVPMTPMIDVTFQLLIYFMLTTVFRQAEGQIPGTLPKAGAAGAATTEQLSSELKISLYAEGQDGADVRYEIDRHTAALGSAKELHEALGDFMDSDGADTRIIINAKSDVRWKYVVEVFNQVVANKFTNIAFQSTT